MYELGVKIKYFNQTYLLKSEIENFKVNLQLNFEISINTKKNFLKLLENVIFIKSSKYLGKFCEMQN